MSAVQNTRLRLYTQPKSPERGAQRIAQIRLHLKYVERLSYIEVAFEAYRIYRDERMFDLPKHEQRHPVGPYTFMRLIWGQNDRYAFLPYIERALDNLQSRHE